MSILSFQEATDKIRSEEAEKARRETDKLIPKGLEELSGCCNKHLNYTAGKEYPSCSCCGSEVIVDYSS
ncbi:MAG: hypothetical protein KKB21_05165 [Nanoarchaeota archaeon]|nr:hypothetical protein [Nanoarchaeota archaeon]MBU4086936.1 hypothetical protein [Nanoarchaeota archaeon]